MNVVEKLTKNMYLTTKLVTYPCCSKKCRMCKNMPCDVIIGIEKFMLDFLSFTNVNLKSC